MKNFGKVKSNSYPNEITSTDKMVFIASNITSFQQELDDNMTITVYEYDYVGYTKDEYIQKIMDENAQKIAQLEEQLEATKILLGVD